VPKPGNPCGFAQGSICARQGISPLDLDAIGIKQRVSQTFHGLPHAYLYM
jgi:hypothetical protein